MAALERLGWAREEEFSVFGFDCAVRSTSPEFVSDLSAALSRFRSPSNQPVWPVFSVVAPAPSITRGRQFHVGYLDHREVFRYEDRVTAQRALFAAMHIVGFGPWKDRYVVLKASAVLVDERVVLVYGPHAFRRTAEILGLTSARHLAERTVLLDTSTAQLLTWPFRVSESPTARDRRGVQMAPLADAVDAAELSLPVATIVRTGPGRTDRHEVIAELMQSCWGGAQRSEIFKGMTRVVSGGLIVNAWRRRRGPFLDSVRATPSACRMARASEGA